ncbi:hypothetical protein [Pontibacillus sp. HMF3514]|uniref:hypothetical protein n=1 Tax=Pontibacillus sp. HMF3514 TaxID=2692425 RepID=UPI00131FE200|nr:hypothetical protein [Pontibacillus sp. HMF3514]QHE53713.1 hypothetical protein GS400_17570 [Pontibacillus sp. HMF3514]
MKKLLAASLIMVFTMGLMVTEVAAKSTVVPGHQTYDGGIPDGDVTGVYTEESEYEGVVYHYRVQYRGDFGGDPYLDSGWMTNHITNTETKEKFFLLIVHESDPRYTGEGTPIWGSWEYHLSVNGNQSDPVENGVIDINKPNHPSNR